MPLSIKNCVKGINVNSEKQSKPFSQFSPIPFLLHFNKAKAKIYI